MISQSRGIAADAVSESEVIENGIHHFDATSRRRDRMRAMANSKHLDSPAIDNLPSAEVAVPVTAPKPIAPKPTVSQTNLDHFKSRVQSVVSHPTVTPTLPPPAAYQPAPQIDSAKSVPVIETPAAATKSNSNTTSSATSIDEYRTFLVGFVVEQTGYPEDIVELDSDLEADLGIDSIKVAQMMGELQERFELDLTKINVKSLDELRTLRQIISVLPTSVQQSPQSPKVPTSEPAPTSAVEQQTTPIASSSHSSSELRSEMTRFLIEFVVEQTGYPEEIVELDADLEADLGIDSIKVAQMMGELNENFNLNVNALKSKTSDDFRTLRAIVDTVVAAGVSSSLVASASSSHSNLGPTVSSSSLNTTALSESNGKQGSRNAQTLQKFLVDFVVEQTGYPEEIVELDSDLEADLGIDSIKIAQMLGELKEQFNLDVSDFGGAKSMDEFKTLRAIINRIAN